MRVRFWGTRGSLPVALTADGLRAKMRRLLRDASGRTFSSDEAIDEYLSAQPFEVAGTYGGHSSCVEIETGNGEYVLCDLGSGARPFAQAAMARHGATPQTYHIVMSHLHWDHIMGLPFFTPAYIAGNRLRIYGGHASLEMALRRQQDRPSFPVDFSAFKSNIEFIHVEPGKPFDVAGMRVNAKLQSHAGDSYGYRFERDGRSLVYSTDSEHKLQDPAETPPSSSSSARPTWSCSTRCIPSPTQYRFAPTGGIRATSSASSSARWRAPGICACSTTSARSATRRYRGCSPTRSAWRS